MGNIPVYTNDTYLVTGAAGFIGFHLSEQLLKKGYHVIGIDNLNDYYDVHLKYARLNQLEPYESFTFIKGDISNKEWLINLFKLYRPNTIVHLAAQAGVRYSIEHPDVYIQSNVVGFYNVLESCRHYPVKHLIYASSSSVYGESDKVPFEETDVVDYPVSLYASTKKSNELMAYTYSHLYKIPTTGLRFFTVYGPMGRPDMSYYIFIDHFFRNKPITIFNNGDVHHDLYRDFTYIDDVVEGLTRLLHQPPPPQNDASYKIYNIGNNHPVKLMTFIETLENALSRSLGKTVTFNKKYEPNKPGDVRATYASTQALRQAIDIYPKTTIQEGLQKFTDWYVRYHKQAISQMNG